MRRRSRQKEAIRKVLRSTTCHPSAVWVYEQVRQEIPNISLGTVYRNLRSLKQDGEILELELSGTLGRFDGNNYNHYHFRCERCGRIFDVDEPIDEKIDDRVARGTGFKITKHCLEFSGLCWECQKRVVSKKMN